MAKERIGILGGTFDPIHMGHIHIGRAAMKQAKLSRVLVMPTGNPPHKAGITPAEDRWRMVCAALAGEESLEPSRLELDRTGTIYTVDTLRILQETYKKAELYFIIGADTLLELKHWHEYENVLKLCTFLVCPRQWETSEEALKAERSRLERLGGHFVNIDMDLVVSSSTDIRKALQSDGETPDLPVCCREYAQLAGLYGMEPRYPSAPEWLEKLFQDLNVRRFAHSLGVANTVRHLAITHHLNVEQAETAGLLHDCAKCMSLREMQRICAEQNLHVDAMMVQSGSLMHGKVGAWIAQERYGVKDPAVLDAIACHTTGRPLMTDLDMAVYLADKIEPGRRDYPALEQIRAQAQLSLEQAMLTSMEGTMIYVKKSGKTLHPATLETIEWLRGKMKLVSDRNVRKPRKPKK